MKNFAFAIQKWHANCLSLIFIFSLSQRAGTALVNIILAQAGC